VNPFDSQKHRKEAEEKESTLREPDAHKKRERKKKTSRKILDSYTRQSHGQMITGCLKTIGLE
jgi:hypothetical protein